VGYTPDLPGCRMMTVVW